MNLDIVSLTAYSLMQVPIICIMYKSDTLK